MNLPYTLLMPKESFIYSLDDTDAAARPFLQYARDYMAHLGVERGSSRLTLAAYESDLRDYFAFLLGRTGVCRVDYLPPRFGGEGFPSLSCFR